MIDPGDYFTAMLRESGDYKPGSTGSVPGVFSLMMGPSRYVQPRSEIWKCVATDGTYISAVLHYADEHEDVSGIVAMFEVRAYDLEIVSDQVAESLVK